MTQDKNPDSVNDTETVITTIQSTKPENTTPVVVKKGGSALALLALLVALGIGGTGYYFGQHKLDEIQQKLTALQTQANNENVAQIPNLEQERTQLTQINQNYQKAQEQITQLTQTLASKVGLIDNLQTDVNQLKVNNKTNSNDWLFSEADYLLNSASYKLIVDNDVDTSIVLLRLADETLQKASDTRVTPVRVAISQDLKQLLAVNNVDQNAIMLRLSQLANSLEELTVLDVNLSSKTPSDTPTDSLSDWQSNVKKSASSFLNHFIRITPRESKDKVLLAPNQDLYLRENIRLRLQIAILAVPRQQEELYKQSLEMVSSWVRSYFDMSSVETQNFLTSVDELLDQSIYVDTPDQLNSLKILDTLLQRQRIEINKITLNADKALNATNKVQTPSESAVDNKLAEGTQQNSEIKIAPTMDDKPTEIKQ